MNTAPLLIRYFQPGSGERLGVLRGDAVHDISHCFPSLVGLFRDSIGDVEGAIAAVAKSADDSASRFPASDLDIRHRQISRIGCRPSISKRSGQPVLPISKAARRVRKKPLTGAMSTPAFTSPSARRSSSRHRAKTPSATATKQASVKTQAGMCPNPNSASCSIPPWRCSASLSATI